MGHMGRHIAIYARVSGRSQDTASQEPDLRRWAEGQDRPIAWYFLGWPGVGRCCPVARLLVFKEKAVRPRE
jgi:hypothetical protein